MKTGSAIGMVKRDPAIADPKGPREREFAKQVNKPALIINGQNAKARFCPKKKSAMMTLIRTAMAQTVPAPAEMTNARGMRPSVIARRIAMELAGIRSAIFLREKI